MTPRPRDLLLHPAALAAIALLVVNDHWLKHVAPSWWTGKLSDAAGMVFFPLLLATAVDVISRRRVAPHVLVAWAAAASALGFALVKTLPLATDGFRWAIGAAQWPLAAAHACLGGAPLPAVAPVVAVTDPSDLLALPFALVPVVLVMRNLTRRVADPRAGERAGQHG